MFIQDDLASILDPDGYYRKDIHNINSLIHILPIHLQTWLCNQNIWIKRAIFLVLLDSPPTIVKVLWELFRIPADQLPSTGHPEHCYALMVYAAGSGHRLTLNEKAGELQQIQLSSSSAALQLASSLDHPTSAERVKASRWIRGGDEDFQPRQALIYAPFIMRNREAIRNLVQQVGDCEAIFSLERGGALVADHIAALLRDTRPNRKIPKLAPGTTVYTKADHINRLKQAIRQQIGQRPTTNIAITETLVGGGSANKILEVVNDMIREFPTVRFQLLFERHTHHQDDDLDNDFIKLLAYKQAPSHKLFRGQSEALKLSTVQELAHKVKYTPGKGTEFLVPTQVPVFIAKARYILGEDVGYQMAYDGAWANQPLIIFDRSRGEIRAVKLTPSGGHTAREMLIRLVLGYYDEVLREYGLL